GAQKVNVCERCEEEKPLYARREANQVKDEPAAVLAGGELTELRDRIHPTEAKLGFGPDGRDVVYGRERLGARLGVGEIGVEQREVELHVERFLVNLARQIHARFGRIDVTIQIQHHVVADDRVTGGKKRHQSTD